MLIIYNWELSMAVFDLEDGISCLILSAPGSITTNIRRQRDFLQGRHHGWCGENNMCKPCMID